VGILTVSVVTEFVNVETVLAFGQTRERSFNSGGGVFRFLGEGNGTSNLGVTTNDTDSFDHFDERV
jgi:hypothetical protein